MPSNFTKQPQFLTQKYFNSGTGDATIGGALTGVPSNVNAGQYNQTLPGDRLVLSAADALALSNTTVGTLYGGIYMYVRTNANSVGTPTIGRLAYWDLTVADSQYQVTPDETGAAGANLIAGVFINTLTKGNSWWICIGGKVLAAFRAVLTGVPAVGVAAYAAAAGAGADLGKLDVLASGANPTFAEVGLMQERYVGVAEALPVAAASSLIDLRLFLYRL